VSRSAAATAAGRRRSLPRSPAPPLPRRVSGPATRPHASPPLRVVAGGAALASRVAGVALDVSGSRAMDRVVRSRAWIVIVAFGLIGIVAMQVSMLKLNAGIGRAVETVNTLERTNASLRGEISRLSAGDRIQSLAGARGFVMPAPADVTYLRAGDLRADGRRAARRMVTPDPQAAGPAGSSTETTSSIVASAAPAAAAAAAAPTAPQAAAPAAQPAAGAPAGAPAAAPSPPASGGAAPAAEPGTTASPAGGVAPPTTASAP